MTKAKRLRAILDRMWSGLILRRDVICKKCTLQPATSPHHIIPRRYTILRWDLDNGIGLCFKCHRIAHDNPAKFDRWLLTNVKVYGELIDKRRTYTFTLPELEEIKEKLKKS